MIKVIYSDIKELLFNLGQWYYYWRQSLKMTMAIRLADIKQKAFNRQYVIGLLCLPKEDKLVSIHRDRFLQLQRIGLLPKMKWNEYKRRAFYVTPLDRNNKSNPKERRKARERYLKYYKKI